MSLVCKEEMAVRSAARLYCLGCALSQSRVLPARGPLAMETPCDHLLQRGELYCTSIHSGNTDVKRLLREH